MPGLWEAYISPPPPKSHWPTKENNQKMVMFLSHGLLFGTPGPKFFKSHGLFSWTPMQFFSRVMGLCFGPLGNFFGVMGLFFGPLGQCFMISWKQKNAQRLYDQFGGSIAPRSLLCVRKRKFLFWPKILDFQVWPGPGRAWTSGVGVRCRLLIDMTTCIYTSIFQREQVH